MKILFVSANPRGTAPLRADVELRQIQRKLRGSKHGDTIQLVLCSAAEPNDLRRALLEHEPDIVHFSGHGAEGEGLLFEDAQEGENPVHQEALSKLFGAFQEKVRLVVLNACHSREIAKVIAQEIDCAVGMAEPIADQAAIEFASAFYEALAFSRPIQEAFDLARNAPLLNGIPEDHAPQLFTRTDIDPTRMRILRRKRVPPLEAALRVESVGAHKKWRVELEGPAGRRAALVDPLTDMDLAAIDALPPDARSWRSLIAHLSLNPRRIRLNALEQIGGLIHERLLGWRGASGWLEQMAAKARERDCALRFVIDLDEYAADVWTLPIEIAFDGTEFMFKRRRDAAVRCDPNLEWARNVNLKRGARVLIATAHEDGQEPSAEKLREIAEALLSAAKRSRLNAEWLADVTPDALHEALTRKNSAPIDVLYLVCHAREDVDHRGDLRLRGGSVKGDQLAVWAADQAERGYPLRAAVLCACASAAQDGGAGTLGTAKWLLRRGKALAAIGFRGPVGVDWMLSFSQRLFKSLGEDESFEAALSEVRWAEPNDDPQWALPLLFARRLDPWGEDSMAMLSQPSGEPGAFGGDLTPESRALHPLMRKKLSYRLVNMRAVQLNVLSDIAWGAHQPPESEVEGARRLTEYLDYTPSAIEIAAGTLRREEISAEAYLEDLRGRLPPGETVPQRIAAVCIRALQSLDPDVRLALYALSVLPPAGAPLEIVAEALGKPEPWTARQLDLLTRHRLATLSPSQGWHVLQPHVREAARSSAASDPDLWDLIHRRIAEMIRDLAISSAESDPKRHSIKAGSLLPTLVAALTFEPWHGGARGGEVLAEALIRLHEKSQLEEPLLHEAVRMAPASSPLLRAYALKARGSARYTNRDIAGAAKDLSESIVLFEAEEDIDGQIVAHEERARVRVKQGDFAAAADDYEKVITLSRGASHAMLEAHGLFELAKLHHSYGSLEFAVSQYERAADILRAERCSDKEEAVISELLIANGRLARIRAALDATHAMPAPLAVKTTGASLEWREIAHALAGRGSVVRAEHLTQEAMSLPGEAAGSSHRGQCYEMLGDISAGDQRKVYAAVCYRSALAAYTECRDQGGMHRIQRKLAQTPTFQDKSKEALEGALDPLGEGIVLKALGDVCARYGALQVAAQEYELALAAVDAAHDRKGQADVLLSRGRLRWRTGDLSGAARDYEGALTIFRADGNRLGEADGLNAQADLRRGQRDFDGAADHYANALAVFQALEDRYGQGHALRGLGDLAWDCGDRAAALSRYLESQAHFEAMADKLSLSSVLARIARVHAVEGRAERMREYAEQARRLAAVENNTGALLLAEDLLRPLRSLRKPVAVA